MHKSKPSEAIDLNYGQDSLDLRMQGDKNYLSIRTEEIEDRVKYLLQIGLQEEAITKIKAKAPTLIHKELVNKRILELQRIGFKDPIKIINQFPSIIGYSQDEYIEPKIKYLESIGFSNVIDIFEKNPTVIGLSLENLISKVQFLKGIGLDVIKVCTRNPGIFNRSIDTCVSKIEQLQTLGFPDPIKLINANPHILSGNIEEKIGSRIVWLKKKGFLQPIKLITLFPLILNLSVDNIEKTIEQLEGYGLSNVIKIIEKFPGVLNYSPKNVERKITEIKTLGFDLDKLLNRHASILGFQDISSRVQGLQNLGIKNISKLIERYPTLLCLSLNNNIAPKIEHLQKVGFSNPVDLINSCPAICAYSVKNIDSKLKIIRRIYNTYGIKLSPNEIFEIKPSLIGIKKERFLLISRLIRDYNIKIDGITSHQIANILWKNVDEIAPLVKKNANKHIREILKK